MTDMKQIALVGKHTAERFDLLCFLLLTEAVRCDLKTTLVCSAQRMVQMEK